ncbi:MAG TPA: ABC transporter ATP-binding protein [Spirochaetota bacterium]|nr:ABC transporter ATP-binding protein [Spirochaetota bacterium]HPP95161.1 ABC transporter ATP-binding protein [Spirochaetota bacterium]
MLQLSNCTAGYEGKIILTDISFSLKKGKVTALLGPNGSGKSTLLKLIDRIIIPQKGEIKIDGKNIKDFSNRELAQTIAYLPQINNALPDCSVFESILLGRKPYINSEPSIEDLHMVDYIIKKFSLENFSFRSINRLSGGEAQKVLIARAIIQKPEILLLDEPINHLDMKNQIEILKIIKEFTKKMNLSSLIVLHDINRALQFCDEFILLKDGKIFKTGDNQIINPISVKKIYGINNKCIELNKRKVIIS